MQKRTKKFDFANRYTLTAIRSVDGFSLIEIMLGVGLFALIVATIAGALTFAQQSIFLVGERARAIDIAEEGLEAARNIRDEAFSKLSAGNNGISTTSSRYNLLGTQDTVDEMFTRVVNIAQPSNVKRTITSTVTWTLRDAQTASVQLMTELTDWRRTAAGGAPSFFGIFDLTTANSGSNIADAISIAFKHPYVYLGRAASVGSEFYVFDVSNPAAPSLLGQLALNGEPNDMIVSGNYVYIASTDNSEELQVIDVSTPTAPFLAASFDLTTANSGNNIANGLSVAISGTTLYYSRANSGGSEFIVFDISAPLLPALLGRVDLNGDPNDIAVAGNYVFVASSDNASELEVVDVTVPALPSLAATLDLSGFADGTAVSYSGVANAIFLGRDGSADPEFYIIDVSAPTVPSTLGSLDLTGTPNVRALDNATSTQLVFLANVGAAIDYRAIDVSNTAAPAELTTLNFSSAPFDLVYGASLDKVFVASSNNAEELEIIAP